MLTVYKFINGSPQLYESMEELVGTELIAAEVIEAVKSSVTDVIHEYYALKVEEGADRTELLRRHEVLTRELSNASTQVGDAGIRKAIEDLDRDLARKSPTEVGTDTFIRLTGIVRRNLNVEHVMYVDRPVFKENSKGFLELNNIPEQSEQLNALIGLIGQIDAYKLEGNPQSREIGRSFVEFKRALALNPDQCSLYLADLAAVKMREAIKPLNHTPEQVDWNLKEFDHFFSLVRHIDKHITALPNFTPVQRALFEIFLNDLRFFVGQMKSMQESSE